MESTFHNRISKKLVNQKGTLSVYNIIMVLIIVIIDVMASPIFFTLIILCINDTCTRDDHYHHHNNKCYGGTLSNWEWNQYYQSPVRDLY